VPRIHTPQNLFCGAAAALDSAAARHVQVLRMQPGDDLTLFNGQGGEFDAKVSLMGRSQVEVIVGTHHVIEREACREVHLAIGMPANERMDWLIEKATELGVASIQPLMSERSVLRLSVERAEKKLAHWQAAVIAACEQCGRNTIPTILRPLSYRTWLLSLPSSEQTMARAILSLDPQALAASAWANARQGHPLLCLSGPEGGLTPDEQSAAIELGFDPVSLGARILRSETAPLAALALWASS
jgi:16S rRNA (uracil1498-N3)-methyltransferase